MNIAARGRATSTANRLLKRAGYELRSKPRPLIRSEHELRMTLEYVLAHLATHVDHPLRIVQVGAFDGSANDPIVDALRRFDCRAVLVEPQPEPFRRLAALHADSESVIVVNAAVDRRDGERDLFTVDPVGMPEWVGQLASFDRGTIEAHQRHLPDHQQIRVRATPVRTVSFETLLSETGLDGVDVLQVDAEGYDLEILRMFDFDRWAPEAVNWEHTHLNRRDRDAAVELAIGLGYQIAMSDGAIGDTVAYRVRRR